MKQLATSYSFNTAAKTITLAGLNVPLSYLLVVINATRNKIIYNLAEPNLGAQSYQQGLNSVVTLKADLTGMANSDQLTIFYDNGAESQIVMVQGPVGPEGEKGDTGDVGPKGDTGVAGAAGEKGDKGDTGDVGPKGDTGTAGATGAKGDKGDTGSVGPKGDTGNVGPKGDTGSVGPKGDTGSVGPAPAGTGIVTVIDGVLQTPKTISQVGGVPKVQGLIVTGLSNNLFNGFYVEQPDKIQGKPQYKNSQDVRIYWDSEYWFIGGGDNRLYSHENHAYPWQVVNWEREDGDIDPTGILVEQAYGIYGPVAIKNLVAPVEPNDAVRRVDLDSVLPTPVVRLEPQKTSLQSLAADGGDDEPCFLKNIPVVVCSNLPVSVRENTFVEMVIYKKGVYSKGDKFTVPPPHITMPWGNNFASRVPTPGLMANRQITITRPNMYPAIHNQAINVYEYLNGRWSFIDVGYNTYSINGQNVSRVTTSVKLFCPLPLRCGSADNLMDTDFNLNVSKFPYSKRFAPLKIAFRYIHWANGQIFEGPLSKTYKIWYTHFPFRLNHYYSSILGGAVSEPVSNPNHLLKCALA